MFFNFEPWEYYFVNDIVGTYNSNNLRNYHIYYFESIITTIDNP